MTSASNSSQQAMLRTAQVFSINPLVGCIDDFVPDSTLEEVEAALAQLELHPARLATLEGAVVGEKRLAQNCKIPPDTISAIDAITAKVAGVFRSKPELCEYPEFIRYEEGDEFKRHFDAALNGSMTGPDADEKDRSQRVFTAILYLNDDFSGGATVFPRLEVELRPKRGTLAFWQNTKAGSDKVHHLSMHQGCPVEAGCKRIVSFWFRDRPWTPFKPAAPQS